MPNLYYCSDGGRVSEQQIRVRYSKAIREKHAGQTICICQACQKEQAVDNSHIIGKARLKHLHKTELIWNPLSFFDSCRRCHDNWEAVKGGRWVFNANLEECMLFLKEHDPEGYRIRIAIMQDIAHQDEFVEKYF